MFIRKLLKVLLSRLFIVSLLILIQLAYLFLIFTALSEYATGIFMLLEFLGLIFVVSIISKNLNPSYKIAWVVTILVFPTFGTIFYLTWGRGGVPTAKLKQMATKEAEITSQLPKNEDLFKSLKSEDENLFVQANYIKRIATSPIYENTSADFLNLGEVKFERMKEELSKAEKFIFMEYFIIEEGKMWDPILKILAEKAASGVEVRVMYDDMGCIQTLPAGYHLKLKKLGIKTTVFNPFRPRLNMAVNYRDHRKICVIDGNVGFCGGVNLADEYINAYEKHGHWKDTAVVIYGEAVFSLTAMFLSNWDIENNNPPADYSCYKPTKSYPTKGYVQPYGDSPHDMYNVGEFNYMQMINRATDYIYITTPYLIIDHEMQTALIMAAQSGVDVRILTPHVADKWYVHILTRAFYTPLVENGVRIYEYEPGFIHAKMVVSDDKVATVGTVNMDFRSFYLHYECGVNFYDSPVITTIKDDINNTFKQSIEFTLADCKKVNMPTRLLRSIIRLFAPMM